MLEVPARSPPFSFVWYSASALALRLAAPARNRATTEALGFGIGHIKLAHTFARVGEGDANGRTLPIGDFLS
jgi:hypothetical protein